MRGLIPQALVAKAAAVMQFMAEDYSAVLADLGDYDNAVLLLGAVDAMCERQGTPRTPQQVAEIAGPHARAREALEPEEWERCYRMGSEMSLEDALALVLEL